MKTNTVFYRPDGRLTVMQVSDPQDLVHVRPTMVRMLDRAYDLVRPDLVLFTGDNILGNHLLDARIGTRQIAHGEEATLEAMRKSIRAICQPLEVRGIPFGMIYGNHDDMNCVSKEAQAEIYRGYTMCLPMNQTGDAPDCDTYRIPLVTADGRLRQNLWMLDSAWFDKAEDRGHAAVKPEATAWYIRESEACRAENGGAPVPSLMFLHIPLPQTEALLRPCPAKKPGSVETEQGWMELDPAKAFGVMGEPPSVLEDDGGLYEALLRQKDVMAVVTGHDHRNCFIGRQDGMDFVQTSAASFRCYGSELRGVRVFRLDADAPDHYETEMLTYADLCGTGPLARLRYFWDADEMIVPKVAVLAGGAVSLLASAVAAGLRKKKP